MSEHADTPPDERTDISSKGDMQDAPIPKSNWSALAAIICAVAGLVIGFIVPVMGFLFYILGGALGLVFSHLAGNIQKIRIASTDSRRSHMQYLLAVLGDIPSRDVPDYNYFSCLVLTRVCRLIIYDGNNS